jgi:hypothetical protein
MVAWWIGRPALPEGEDHGSAPMRETARVSASAAPVRVPARNPIPGAAIGTPSGARSIAHPGDPFRQFSEWLGKLSEAAPAPGAAGERLAEGLAIVRQRQAELSRLIRDDPEAALARAVSWQERERVPAELRPWLEEPFSETADVEVVFVCGEGDPTGREPERRLVASDGSRVGLHVYGRRKAWGSKRGQPVNGIRLSGQAAVRESVLQPVSATEAALLKDRFPMGNPDPARSWVSGRMLDRPRYALAAGRLHALADDAELAALEQRLAELESLPGPASALAFLSATGEWSTEGRLDWGRVERAALHGARQWTETPKRVLIIRADFPDQPGHPSGRDEILASLNGPIAQWFRTQSRGKTWIEAEVTREVFRLGTNGAAYVAADQYSDDVLTHARGLAAPRYPLASYDIVGVAFPNVGFPWAGLAGGSQVWLQGSFSAGVTAHEFGHNYGLSHASAWRTTDGSVLGPGERVEYGNPFDRMGSGSFPEGYFQPNSLDLLNWAGPADAPEITAPGRYRLAAHDRFWAGPIAYRVALGTNVLWLSYRALTGTGWEEVPGLEINQVIPGQRRQRLLDLTPGTAAGFRDATLAVGFGFGDPEGTVNLTALARGGEAPDEWIEFALEFGPFDSNHAPSVSLATIPTPAARRPTEVRSRAADADGDALVHHWSVDGGPWTEGGEVWNRALAIGGDHEVRVRVSDLRSGMAESQVRFHLPDPLREWTSATLPTTARVSALAEGGGRLLAVAGSRVFTALAGDDWTETANLGAENDVRDLVHANGEWLAVGQRYDWDRRAHSGLLWHSRDGIAWTQVSPPGLPGLARALAGNGRWLVMGDRPVFLTSSDAKVWVPVLSQLAEAYVGGAAFGNGRFLVSTSAGGWLSEDGKTWHPWNREDDPDPCPWKLAWVPPVGAGGGRFYRFGCSSAGLESSEDGVVWIAPGEPGQPGDLAAVTLAAPGLLTAVTSSGQRQWASLDGRSWDSTAVEEAPSGDLVAHAGRLFGIGPGGRLRTSEPIHPGNRPPSAELPPVSPLAARQPVTLQVRAADPDGDPVRVFWDHGDGRWQAGAPERSFWWPIGGRLTLRATTVDGRGGLAMASQSVEVHGPLTSWTPAVSASTNRVLEIVEGRTRFVARTERRLLSSPDAITWQTAPSLGINARVERVATDGPGWFAAGWDYDFGLRRWKGALWNSGDGDRWNRMPIADGPRLIDLAVGNGIWIALADDGSYLRSTDGLDWTAIWVPELPPQGGSLVFAHGAFLVGDRWSGTVFASVDGWAWQRQAGSLPRNHYLGGLFSVGDHLLALTTTAGAWRSSDRGGAWQPLGIPAPGGTVAAVAYLNGLYLAFGVSSNSPASPATSGAYVSTDALHWQWMGMPSLPSPTACAVRTATGQVIVGGAAGEMRLSDPLPPPPDDWDGWRGFHLGAVSGPGFEHDDDADGDRLSNLSEYAFGSHPADPESRRFPRVEVRDGYAVMVLEKLPGRGALRYDVSLPEALNPGLPATERTPVLLEDSAARLRVRWPFPVATRPAAFVAVRPHW